MPIHLAVGHRGPELLQAISRFGRRGRELLVRSGEGGRRQGGARETARVPERSLPPECHARATHRWGLYLDTSRCRTVSGPGEHNISPLDLHYLSLTHTESL